MQPQRVNNSVSLSTIKTSDTPELAAVHSKDDNSEGSENNNSKDSEDDNSKNSEDDNSENSESEEAAKTEDNNPTSNNNEHVTTYHIALARSQLYIITEKENRVCYKKCIMY